MVKFINGNAIAAEIRKETRREIAEKKLKPGLAIVLVGDDPASKLYIKLKKKAALELGIDFHEYTAPKDAGESYIFEIIEWLNNDPAINGVVLQLPLPENLSEDRLISAIDPLKDADGFHKKNIETLKNGMPYIRPALLETVIRMLKETGEKLSGKHALIISNAEIFAEPLLIELPKFGVKPEYINPNNNEVLKKCGNADIIIIAVGIPAFLKDEQCKKGAIVIDIGINKVDGKTVGDVNPDTYEKCENIKWISPVPGGVGPVTIAMLLKNVVELAKRQNLKYE